MDYALLDSGQGQKLERFGKYTLVRPAAQAVWAPKLPEKVWHQADAHFTREKKGGWGGTLPEAWTVAMGALHFHLRATDFGHLGLFPEHVPIWEWIEKRVQPGQKFLNLFAYSGAATLAAARAGAEVWHVDASGGMVSWAAENAELNGLKKAPIRWIVEDVRKYVRRLLRRGERFEGILLDPPTFGRGKAHEVFKIEEHLPPLLDDCASLLSDTPSFFVLSCHTPGYTPIVLRQLLQERLEGSFESDEMALKGPFDLPSGAFARWIP